MKRPKEHAWRPLSHHATAGQPAGDGKPVPACLSRAVDARHGAAVRRAPHSVCGNMVAAGGGAAPRIFRGGADALAPARCRAPSRRYRNGCGLAHRGAAVAWKTRRGRQERKHSAGSIHEIAPSARGPQEWGKASVGALRFINADTTVPYTECAYGKLRIWRPCSRRAIEKADISDAFILWYRAGYPYARKTRTPRITTRMITPCTRPKGAYSGLVCR
jgi:hypothetical protein